MRNAFRKNVFRTIKKSMGRYMAIFAIIALGVGFFSGLKGTKPAMMKTGQEYVQEQSLYDYRLISTWGFDEKEIAGIGKLEGVKVAEGAVWEDFIYVNDQGAESCLKALSITENVNKLTLEAGRLPDSPNECVVDAYTYSEDMIGQKITISSGNGQETKDSFAYDTYTVTGLVRSPLYMNMERGTTTIGNGKIDSFVFLPLDGFSYEYFEEVYVDTDINLTAFSQAYEDAIEDGGDRFKEAATTVIEARYEKEMADAEAKIADAEKELSEKLEEAKQELADAKEELLDGQKALEDGKRELADGEKQLQETEQELLQGEGDLEQGEIRYQQGLKEYQTGLLQYENALAQLEAGKPVMDPALYEAQLQQLAMVKSQLDAAKAQLDTSFTQIEASKAMIAQGKSQLEQGKKEIQTGWQEIKKNEKTLEEGWKEYEDGVTELEEETGKAKQEIADAKEELAQVEAPEIYVLNRNMNVGYASYESDVSIVEAVAKVFPVFFFLIAALVCSTTMTRMVDDERTQIGTLRALGYTNGAILSKYLIYSGTAAGLGAIVGYFAGTRIFPATIWIAYGMLYGFADIIIVDNIWLLVISLLVALLCSAGTTFAACRLELKHAPAELIRPKAPSAGKRILLERIPFVWKHLKFLHKVSVRNIFRFKKRMIMMILGIAGCMALVMAGFGVHDSVTDVVNIQYEDILKYDISASYTKEITRDTQDEIAGKFGEDILHSALLLETSVEAPFDGGSKTITLMVSEDPGLGQCVDFHSGDTKIGLPGEGEILIDNRLSKELAVVAGDEITLKVGDKETKPLKVAGIFENYTFYYACVTGETYEEYFGESYEPKTIYYTLEDEADHYKMGSYLSDMENAANTTVVADMRGRIQNTMQSMNFIVALIIACAAALAFIVLFNLGNINISERVREIATLKVLGFYPRETGAYVFRENVLLSILGIIVGIPLGIWLNHFVVTQIQIDLVSFKIQIKPISYVFSVVAVLAFTVCVDLIMRRKINRIHMAESLKSIE